MAGRGRAGGEAERPLEQGSRKRLTITFDNGPDPAVTERVLDVLDRYAVLSTFFVIGRRLVVPGAEAVNREAARRGHWIGNHTFTHDIPLGERLEPDAPETEIGRTQQLIEAVAHPERYFRPPGARGHLDKRLLSRAAFDHLCAHRYTCVLWNSVPGDLWPDTDWVARAHADIARLDWTLLVLHDIEGGCVARLEEFLDGLDRDALEIRQDFPDALVPLVRGEPRDAMMQFVTDAPAGRM